MNEPAGREKRAIPRFALELPVKVNMPTGNMALSAATTKDVSSLGVCFTCDSALEKDSEIEFTLTLPSTVTMTEPINVRCVGKVVRVGGNKGAFEVAAAIQNYEFVSDDQTLKVYPPINQPPRS
jgi:hypothetical protein